MKIQPFTCLYLCLHWGNDIGRGCCCLQQLCTPASCLQAPHPTGVSVQGTKASMPAQCFAAARSNTGWPDLLTCTKPDRSFAERSASLKSCGRPQAAWRIAVELLALMTRKVMALESPWCRRPKSRRLRGLLGLAGSTASSDDVVTCTSGHQLRALNSVSRAQGQSRSGMEQSSS